MVGGVGRRGLQEKDKIFTDTWERCQNFERTTSFGDTSTAMKTR